MVKMSELGQFAMTPNSGGDEQAANMRAIWLAVLERAMMDQDREWLSGARARAAADLAGINLDRVPLPKQRVRVVRPARRPPLAGARELAREALAVSPGLSNGRIAVIVGCSPSVVSRVRAAMQVQKAA